MTGFDRMLGISSVKRIREKSWYRLTGSPCVGGIDTRAYSIDGDFHNYVLKGPSSNLLKAPPQFHSS